MKSILYVGATLMIGASIYGFVDYKQTKGKKEFKSMYTEKKAIAPVVTTDVQISPDVKKEEQIDEVGPISENLKVKSR